MERERERNCEKIPFVINLHYGTCDFFISINMDPVEKAHTKPEKSCTFAMNVWLVSAAFVWLRERHNCGHAHAPPIFILNLMKMNVRRRKNHINHEHENKIKNNMKGFQHLVDDETFVISWKSPTISQIVYPLHCSNSKLRMRCRWCLRRSWQWMSRYFFASSLSLSQFSSGSSVHSFTNLCSFGCVFTCSCSYYYYFCVEHILVVRMLLQTHRIDRRQSLFLFFPTFFLGCFMKP